jgi:hypothetical protein
MSNITSDNVAELFGCVNNNNTPQGSCAHHNEPEDALTSTSKVENLAKEILDLKGKMAEQKALLDSKESELVMICGHEEEGSKKFNTENFTITTTGKLTRKIVDETAIQGLAPEVLRTKVELDGRKLKSLATKNPMLYRKVASCIEAKPAKTYLRIEPNKG